MPSDTRLSARFSSISLMPLKARWDSSNCSGAYALSTSLFTVSSNIIILDSRTQGYPKTYHEESIPLARTMYGILTNAPVFALQEIEVTNTLAAAMQALLIQR